MSSERMIRAVTLIRATHRDAYRSGEWARVYNVGVEATSLPSLRPCWHVVFVDGKTDSCPVHDSTAGYEFKVGDEMNHEEWSRVCAADDSRLWKEYPG